jgi:hypothetical protein
MDKNKGAGNNTQKAYLYSEKQLKRVVINNQTMYSFSIYKIALSQSQTEA